MRFVLLLAAAMIAAIGPLHAATTDPLKVIYRISGLLDNGSTGKTGVATAVVCTNFGNAREKMRFVVRNETGAVKAELFFIDFDPRISATVVTHPTALFTNVDVLNTGAMSPGSMTIQSTSLLVHCSAMIVDAAATVPQGIELHMVRINPVTASQE
jgi:hypothetical protein